MVSAARCGRHSNAARGRLAHACLIDPLARTLQVFRLERCHWMLAATHAGDEVVRAEPFDEIDLELRLLWPEPAGGPERG